MYNMISLKLTDMGPVPGLCTEDISPEEWRDFSSNGINGSLLQSMDAMGIVSVSHKAGTETGMAVLMEFGEKFPFKN